jgi:hypothetical protein
MPTSHLTKRRVYNYSYLLMVYLTKLSTPKAIKRRTVKSVMINELESVWEGAIVTQVLCWPLPG